MTFDRFTDDLQIGDVDDSLEFKECKQCGESFETDCHAVIDEFCSEDCEVIFAGVGIETECEE